MNVFNPMGALIEQDRIAQGGRSIFVRKRLSAGLYVVRIDALGLHKKMPVVIH